MAIVTWDPNNKGSNVTLSSDNYTVTINAISQGIRTTVGKSYGKWYWEVTNVSGASAKFIGIASSTVSMSNGVSSNANVRIYYGYNGTTSPGGKSYGASYTNGDIISVLVDLDNGTLEFWKNGVSQGISHTDIKTLGTIYPVCTSGTSNGSITYYANFGQTSFSYTPPVGFLPYGNNPLILVEKENNILTYNSSNASWEIISTSNSLNKDLFVNYGLSEYELSYASNTVLELSNFEILIWNEASNDLNAITINAIPKPQIVKQIKDVSFNGELQNIQLEDIEESGPIFKIITSNDNGNSWKSFKSNNWIFVDVTNLLDIKENGMTSAEFNAITQSQWEELGLYSNNIRFAYYLEQNNSNEVLEVNSLSANSKITTITPTVSSITINYSELDKKYSGLMFMDTSQQYYSTSFGEILQYLDFNTMISGQTSLDVKVILTNTYPFNVKNIRLTTETDVEGLTIELSKSNNPFVAESYLIYDQQLNFDETIEFYVRLSTSDTAVGSGTFDIKVEADAV